MIFKKQERSIDDKPRSGHPSTAQTDKNVENNREIITGDWCRTIDKLVELSWVTRRSVRRMLTQGSYLTVEQKQMSRESMLCFEKEVPKFQDYRGATVTTLKRRNN